MHLCVYRKTADDVKVSMKINVTPRFTEMRGRTAAQSRQVWVNSYGSEARTTLYVLYRNCRNEN